MAAVVLELGEYVMHEIMDCSEKFLRERNLEEQGGERSKAAEVRWPVLFCLARAPLPSKIDIRVLVQMRRVFDANVAARVTYHAPPDVTPASRPAESAGTRQRFRTHELLEAAQTSR